MAHDASPHPEPFLGGDARTIDRQLDETLPGWRDYFGEDLADDVDLRPAVARVRAVLLMLQVRAAAGDLPLIGKTPAQTVSDTCEWIRAQLYGPELRGAGRHESPRVPPSGPPTPRGRHRQPEPALS
jgi:hypothetical protein